MPRADAELELSTLSGRISSVRWKPIATSCNRQLLAPSPDQQERHGAVQPDGRPQQRAPEMRDRAHVTEEKRDQRALGEHRSERGRAGLLNLPLRPAGQSKCDKRNAHAAAEQRRQLGNLRTHQQGGDHFRRDHQGDAGADFDDRAEGKESSQCNEGRFAHVRRPDN